MDAKKLICFDLDNTIIHSDKSHTLAFQKALKKLKLKVIPQKDISIHFGKPKFEVGKAISSKKDKRTVNLVLYWHDHYLYKETKKYVKRISGVMSVLKKLKKKYKLALVSNCRHRNILLLLKEANIPYKTFDIIIGNDDVKHSKPAPDEILKAEKLLHTNADYMVGDTIYDIMAAKRAKAKAIVVLTGRQNRKTLKKKKPYKIINSIKQLPKILKC